MIKNLLEADDKDSLETKPAIEEKAADETEFEETPEPNFSEKQNSETNDAEDFLEIPELTMGAPIDSEEAASEAINFELPAEPVIETAKSPDDNTLFQSSAEPESIGETARKSGLAYGAAISLFGSVIFMLIIGWGADLLLGTSPWGIIGGITLGAIIGFFQFFRITSQIFKK